jgi:hypothetical protein
MPPDIKVGAILIEDWPMATQFLGLESKPYSEKWSLVKVLDGFALDRKIHASGWNFFFMATQVKAMFFGTPGAQKIQNALKRIFGKVKRQHFNAVEVTEIVTRRFLGVPYSMVSAHSRHIQQSCYLHNTEARRTSRRDAKLGRN